jgi:hypothetical protein
MGFQTQRGSTLKAVSDDALRMSACLDVSALKDSREAS